MSLDEHREYAFGIATIVFVIRFSSIDILYPRDPSAKGIANAAQ
jgi:hypothetical protein